MQVPQEPVSHEYGACSAGRARRLQQGVSLAVFRRRRPAVKFDDDLFGRRDGDVGPRVSRLISSNIIKYLSLLSTTCYSGPM